MKYEETIWPRYLVDRVVLALRKCGPLTARQLGDKIGCDRWAAYRAVAYARKNRNCMIVHDGERYVLMRYKGKTCKHSGR